MSDAEELLEAIRVLLRAFTVDENRFPPAEGRIKYNPHDFQTLFFVAGNPGCRGAELATFLGVAPTTAQSVIDRLIERGFVLRAENTQDRRAVSLYLTDEGVDVTQAIRRQDLANCRAMLSALPKTERKRFAQHMALIADSIAARENA